MKLSIPLSREARMFPLYHNFEWGFGLSAESTTKASTILPIVFQDNALVDYETIKVHPDNNDFAVVAYPNVMRGSKISHIQVGYMMSLFESDTEINMLKVNTMNIHTNMLNRLDAFDRKTGNDIETIIELQHETTDEQAGALYNGTKLFEGQGVRDLDFTKVPFLTTDGQFEGVNFDKEMYFDARRYYTNQNMLKTVTSPMMAITLTDPLVNAKHAIFSRVEPMHHSICVSAEEYMYCGKLFHVPQVGSLTQYTLAGQTTAIEHVSVKGWVSFWEHNNDFNFARA